MQVSWKTYVDSRFREIQRATDSARYTMEKRLEGMNEFRDQLKDQAGTFVRKDDLEAIKDDIRMLRESRATLEGKASQSSMLFVAVLAVVGAVTGILTLVLKVVE